MEAELSPERISETLTAYEASAALAAAIDVAAGHEPYVQAGHSLLGSRRER
jgi:hypothetical protein